jgi:hypothetical protein
LDELHNWHSLDYLRSRVTTLESIICELLVKIERLRCLHRSQSPEGSLKRVDHQTHDDHSETHD